MMLYHAKLTERIINEIYIFTIIKHELLYVWKQHKSTNHLM